MNAKQFFRHGVKDNNQNGLKISEIIQVSSHDDIFHNKSRNRENFRKPGIHDYLRDLFKCIASKNLSELNLTQLTFDTEFEANTDQRIFNLTGSSFDELTIYTGNIIGSIKYKGHIFNINCRFGNFFLQYMIASTSGFLEMENFGSISKEVGLGEWILIYYWKLQLKKAFALGIYKTYKAKKENLSVVRGNIDINRSLHKFHFDGKTVCDFKEHSYKNEINSVISMALSKVFKSKYQSIVADIYNVKCAFDSINTFRVIASKVNGRVNNSFFKKYNHVFDLSLKIMIDEFANIGDSQSDISAFLFDISLLFEYHIRKLLKLHFQLFPKNKKEFSVPNGISRNDIFPDVIINFQKNEVGIYDVKYKNFDFRNNGGVNREDRFQLISYVAIHMTRYKVVECGIIYPLKQEFCGNTISVRDQTLDISGEKIPFVIKFYRVSDNIEDQRVNDQLFVDSFTRKCDL